MPSQPTPRRILVCLLILFMLAAALIFVSSFLLANGNLLAVAVLGTMVILFLPSGALLLASLS